MIYLIASVLLSTLLVNVYSANYESLPPPCESEIYCHGPLLHKVQMTRIFKDSKTFVDLNMKYTPDETMARFYKLMNDTGTNPGYLEVYNFVNETFSFGKEFKEHIPSDWTEHPAFINKITDARFKNWATELNKIWKILGRKIKEEIENNTEKYSIIWVPNHTIVPGGRFAEFYYWDSYWIIKGLLLSEMTDTAKGMLDNFLGIVEKYGFVPNGGRVYYTRRSQPPLLIPSIKLYYDFTKNLDYIKKNIDLMEKEYLFWMNNRTVPVTINGKTYKLAAYGDGSRGPRPESFWEDVSSAGLFSTEEQKEHHYTQLKAAAESGWDFSSRWFISANGTNEGNITNLETTSIIPVDLNSFMYENAKLLAEFYKLLDNTTKYLEYTQKAEEWLEGVTNVLWNEDAGIWLDYDLKNMKPRDYFYPSNLVPLFNKCYNLAHAESISKRVRKYLQKYNITDYKGGVPTSLYHTGEQWDFPNAWPPMQHMLIMGLDMTGDPHAQKAAYDFALAWVRSNYIAFAETGYMFEKYDAETPGGHGRGGEYEVQLGFGWSNAIIMDLLDKYGDRMEQEKAIETEKHVADIPPVQHSSASTFGQALAGLLIFLVTVAVGFIGVDYYKRRGHAAALSNVKTKIIHKVHYTELRDIPEKEKTIR